MDDQGTQAVLVRRAREDAGLSQRQLAALSGVRQPNLAAIESGARKPGHDVLDRILRAARLRPSIALELKAADIRRIADHAGLHNVRVFGSAVRGTDTEHSDVDLLVDAGTDVDFLALAAFREEVSRLIGFPVDAVVDDGDDAAVRAIRSEAVPL